MKINLIGCIITFAGLIFFAISLFIVISGKKIDNSSGRRTQNIRVGKFVELSLNSVLMLLVLTAAISLSPLILSYWKPDLATYMSRDDVNAKYILKSDLCTTIRGNVTLEDGRPAKQVRILVMQSHTGRNDTLVYMTDQAGWFEFMLKPDAEKNIVVWQKDGYQSAMLNYKFKEVSLPVQLKKGDDN